MDYPKHVLKRKKLNKKKTAIVFRRNYLSIDDFVRIDDGWIFQEKFTHYGTKCNVEIRIYSPNFTDIFSLNSKTVKIKGSKEKFGVYFRINNSEMPFEQNVNYGLVQFHIDCSGNNMVYDDGTGIKNTKAKQIDRKIIGIRRTNKSNNIAPLSNAGYAMTHPYQGGGMSPR